MSVNENSLEQKICYVCEKHFTNIEEEIVQISSRKFNASKFAFEVLRLPTRRTPPLTVAREINFHVQCFTEIAGTKFVP